MSISILNNASAMAAHNQLSMTNVGLQKTLFRLSSGSRINSGADDAAGLAVADGLRANITALDQSSRNANDGIGKLQVADGALAQVTSLLTRAVSLATESATGSITNSQRTDIDAEFTAIKSEIDRIGTNTTFNGAQIFQAATGPDPNSFASTNGSALSLTTALTTGKHITVTEGANTFTYTAAAGDKVADAINAINSQSTVQAQAYLNGSGALVISDPQKQGTINVTTDDSVLAGFNQPTVSQASNLQVFLSDSTSSGSSTISVALGAVSKSSLNFGGSTVDLSSDTLSTQAGAQAALSKLNQAIQNVAGTRGAIGAGVNRLQTAVNVISNQQQNLSSAEDGVRAADISQEVANMTKYNILMQTGMSALSQANQSQQAVLKLLQ